MTVSHFESQKSPRHVQLSPASSLTRDTEKDRVGKLQQLDMVGQTQNCTTHSRSSASAGAGRDVPTQNSQIPQPPHDAAAVSRDNSEGHHPCALVAQVHSRRTDAGKVRTDASTAATRLQDFTRKVTSNDESAPNDSICHGVPDERRLPDVNRSTSGVRSSESLGRHLQADSTVISPVPQQRHTHSMGCHQGKHHSREASRPPTDHSPCWAAASAHRRPDDALTHQSPQMSEEASINQTNAVVHRSLATTQQHGQDQASLHLALSQTRQSSGAMEASRRWRNNSRHGSSSPQASFDGGGAGLLSVSSTGSAGYRTQQEELDAEIRRALASADRALDNSHTVGTRLLLRRRRARLPNPTQLKQLPLHAKHVKHLDLDKLRSYMKSEVQARLDELMAALHFHPSHSETEVPRLRIPVSHAKQLQEAGVFEHIGSVDSVDISTLTILQYFTVVEERAAGERLRPIMWPESLLNASNYVSQFSLPAVHDYRLVPLLGSHAVAFDLAASFWQVLLSQLCRFAVICEDGRIFKMLRLPYGVDVASEIMQILTLTLAGCPSVCKQSQWRQLSIFVHIDNALFVGTQRDAELWKAALLERARECAVQLNVEESNNVNVEQDFVGLHFDFTKKTTCLKHSFKVPEIRINTAEDLERMMGKLIYAGTALGLPLHEFKWTIKTYRRILSLTARTPRCWTSPITLSRVVLREIQAWRNAVIANTPAPVEPSVLHSETPEVIVATDATPVGYGGVIFELGRLPEAFGGLWPSQPSSINEAETLAAAVMLLRFAPRLASKRVLLLIDNTSTIARILKAARGGALEPHRIAQSIIDIAREHNFAVRVQYIESARNPADAVSRQAPVDMELAMAVVNEAWGRKGCKARRARGRVEAPSRRAT